MEMRVLKKYLKHIDVREGGGGGVKYELPTIVQTRSLGHSLEAMAHQSYPKNIISPLPFFDQIFSHHSCFLSFHSQFFSLICAVYRISRYVKSTCQMDFIVIYNH